MIKETLKKLRTWYEEATNSLVGIDHEKPTQQETTMPKDATRRYLINVCIGEQTLTLIVTQASEFKYREAAKRLNDYYQNFKQQFPDASQEELLAIVAMKEALSKTLQTK